MTRRTKIAARIGLLALVAGLLSACDPIVLPPTGGGTPATCPAGAWTVDALSVTTPINTPLGTITISESGAGVSLTLTDTTWTLQVDETIAATLTNQIGSASGSVHVSGDASGTYTKTASTLTFKLGSITGTAAYDVTLFGHHLTGTLSLPTSGLEKLYGLTGNANYSCTTTGLALEFAHQHMHAHR